MSNDKVKESLFSIFLFVVYIWITKVLFFTDYFKYQSGFEAMCFFGWFLMTSSYVGLILNKIF